MNTPTTEVVPPQVRVAYEDTQCQTVKHLLADLDCTAEDLEAHLKEDPSWCGKAIDILLQGLYEKSGGDFKRTVMALCRLLEQSTKEDREKIKTYLVDYTFFASAYEAASMLQVVETAEAMLNLSVAAKDQKVDDMIVCWAFELLANGKVQLETWSDGGCMFKLLMVGLQMYEPHVTAVVVLMRPDLAFGARKLLEIVRGQEEPSQDSVGM